MLVGKDRNFKDAQEYFDYLVDSVGYPAIHNKFYSDKIVSENNSLHLDIYEHHRQAPTIVFIPGTSIYGMCYAEVLEKIGSQGYNIVSMDPRGHGRSSGERGDYTISELMNDAQNVITYAINKFGDNVSLMGSSQGGIVAFYVAAKDKRIKGVTCQNFADLTWSESTRLTRFPRVSKLLKPMIEKIGDITPNTQIPVSIYLDLEKIEVKYFGNAKNFMDTDPLALKAISFRAFHSLATTKIPKPVEEIDIPVMVFQGDADTIFPVDYTQQIFDKLTVKKQFDLFPGLNHAIMTEDPDVILNPILNWLGKIH